METDKFQEFLFILGIRPPQNRLDLGTLRIKTSND